MLLSPARPPSPGVAALVETWGGSLAVVGALAFVVVG